MTIDWAKPILWDGKPARVLATDMNDGSPVLIRKHDGCRAWCDLQGCNPFTTERVTNAPERVERWANMGGPDTLEELMWHKTKADADRYKGPACTSQLHGTFENDKLVDVAIVPLEDK